MQTISEEALYTLKFINQTNQSLFLTGKAGTGKTTLLREIIQTTHKNTVVVAPTGIAALNAGGVTIHSMFQLPFGGFLPDNITPQFSEHQKFESKATLRRHFKMSGLKKSVILNMELLIIDEVSMLRADLLDAIDFMMQSVRKNKRPFGGVQVLFIGDLLQLPPVVKENEWQTLKQYYKGIFFFHSHVIQQYPPLYIELSKIFRQTDSVFISLLNNLRNNQISQSDVANLNQFVQPNFDFKKNPGYIILTTHNAKADAINSKTLQELQGKEWVFNPAIVADFPEKIYPIEADLKLKVGAQVMFVKNDLSFDKKYFNGKMGTIKSISEEEILVYFPDEDKTIEVEKYEWQNIRYKVNPDTKEIEEEVQGTFVHYPIKLAWAITVHKSQGLTFDKAALDVSQVFLPGQAYVALSRLRSLNGLVLLSPLQMNGISNDTDVMEYATRKATEAELESALQYETKRFICNYLLESFDWTNLAQEWRNHAFNSPSNPEKSVKSKQANWGKKQLTTIDSLLEPSRKFQMQIQTLFAAETVDLDFIAERINAAYNYFIKPMDDLVFEVLWKIEEIIRTKKAKAFYDDLVNLEELQTKAVLRLMKAKAVAETIANNQQISKDTFQSPEIKTYKSNKVAAIQKEYKKVKGDLIEDESHLNRYAPKSKTGPKELKKSTLQETHELWLASNTLPEIAAIRKLTVQTITGHFTKLIAAKQVEISDLLPPEKISELEKAFKGYTNDSLNELKEKYDNQFTWDELKMFKASLAAS